MIAPPEKKRQETGKNLPFANQGSAVSATWWDGM